MGGMCGIAGLASRDGLGHDAQSRAIAMRDVLTHRGPDEAGLYTDTHAVLAHRRLSIVDLKTGQQPLGNEDGRIWVSFNGEIYNHADVRRELEPHGHIYRTKSDTETIVHAYEQWGDECVHRFRGMFAFAVWDSAKRRLLLVRDRLGIKPLYWARVGDTLLFASEIKAIIASGLVKPIANESRLPEVLSTRYVAGAETLFHGIQKLLPGHLLVFEHGDVQIRQYLGCAGRQTGRSAPPQRRGRRRRIPRPTRGIGPPKADERRAVGDVSLGRDRQQRDRGADGAHDRSAAADLLGGVSPSERSTSSTYAREVARTVNADGHEVVIDDRDFFGALPRLVWHEDEPIAHPSSVPLYFVSALARQHVTVVLTGEGSDELLAGYGKYPRIAWNWRAGTFYERMVPKAARRALAEGVVPRLPGRLGRYARRSFLAMDRTPAAMFLDNFASIRLDDQRQLLAHRLRASVDGDLAYAPSLVYFDRPNGQSTLIDRLLYADMKTYLVELLMKQDQMSMATSIESRVPFLDHKLVEFAASLPDEWKLSGLTTKRILREAMRGILPPSILNRPKMGFPVPFAAWTRGAWNGVARDVLLDRRTRERGIIDPPGVDRLLRDHARRTDRRRRPHLEPHEPRALVPHVHRRRRHSDPGPTRRPTHPMRILWLKSDLLLPLDKGGRLRTWHLMRHLARRHDITYLSFAERSSPTGWKRGRAPRRDRSPDGSREGNAALLRRRRAASGRSAALRGRRSTDRGASRGACDELLAEQPFDLIVCDFLSPAVNLPQRLPCPAVIFTHNVESEIWRRHAETKTGIARLLYRQQHAPHAVATKRRTLARFDGVLAVSDCRPRDLRTSVSGTPCAETSTSSRPASTPSSSRHRTERAGRARNLVFTGSMDWLPNEDAMTYFCRDILPRIRAEEPDATLTIVGRAPTPAVRRLAAEPGVTVTGRVDDVRPYMRRRGGLHRAAPDRRRHAAENLRGDGHGQSGRVDDGRRRRPAGRARRAPADRRRAAHASPAPVVRLFRDVERRRAIEAAARALVVERYDWSAVAGELEQALVRLRPSAAPERRRRRSSTSRIAANHSVSGAR